MGHGHTLRADSTHPQLYKASLSLCPSPFVLSDDAGLGLSVGEFQFQLRFLCKPGEKLCLCPRCQLPRHKLSEGCGGSVRVRASVLNKRCGGMKSVMAVFR